MYGYPRDGINGMFGALASAEGEIRFNQAHHEVMATFTADAKLSAELGVGIATSAPGAAYMLTDLYNARMDPMPVLAIVGQQARNALGGH